MEDKIKKFLKELRLNESLISTAMGVVVILIIGVLLYNYFAKKSSTSQDVAVESITGQPEEKTDQPVVPDGLPTTHKVVKGEHLWGIAEKYYGSGYNWVDIVKENNLKNPNRIFVDQELTIPAVEVRQASRPAPTRQAANTVGLTISGDKYQIQSGDNLWTISVRAYADGFQWTKIYNENKEKIGQNPNLIFAGVELDIPRQL